MHYILPCNNYSCSVFRILQIIHKGEQQVLGAGVSVMHQKLGWEHWNLQMEVKEEQGSSLRK